MVPIELVKLSCLSCALCARAWTSLACVHMCVRQGGRPRGRAWSPVASSQPEKRTHTIDAPPRAHTHVITASTPADQHPFLAGSPLWGRVRHSLEEAVADRKELVAVKKRGLRELEELLRGMRGQSPEAA